MYDASKANRVCEVSVSTQDRGDFGWHDTELYRTASGRFFVAGEGGPGSMWAERVDQNSWRSGEGMRAVTEGEARGYMESAGCSAEEFVKTVLPLEEARRFVVQENAAAWSPAPSICALAALSRARSQYAMHVALF